MKPLPNMKISYKGPILAFLLAGLLCLGCGTLAGLRYTGSLGIRISDLISITFVETSLEIYRVDEGKKSTVGIFVLPPEIPDTVEKDMDQISPTRRSFSNTSVPCW